MRISDWSSDVCSSDLGFDAEGHRLGMGGGFYDATLKAFRSDGLPLLAIGYAFAVQQVAELPHGAMDERLDLVVTERGAIDCHADELGRASCRERVCQYV